MKNLIGRNPETVLPLSLKFAKEYFDMLCKMQKDINESEELTIHRALWTALIIEVGRLFDTYSKKDVVSFKKLPYLKKQIDNYHSVDIIRDIIETRNTFTGHFSKEGKNIISAPEICRSDLSKILKGMSKLSVSGKKVTSAEE